MHVQYLAHLIVIFILYSHLILLFGYGTDSTLWSAAENGAVGRCPSTYSCVGMILLLLLSQLATKDWSHQVALNGVW